MSNDGIMKVLGSPPYSLDFSSQTRAELVNEDGLPLLIMAAPFIDSKGPDMMAFVARCNAILYIINASAQPIVAADAEEG